MVQDGKLSKHGHQPTHFVKPETEVLLLVSSEVLAMERWLKIVEFEPKWRVNMNV